MKINPELFVIPNNDDFILYSPLHGRVLKVNSGLVNKLQKFEKGESVVFEDKIKEQLEEFGVFIDGDLKIPKGNNSGWEYKPTKVTLMPTWDCNLRCVYCYSQGGESDGKVMELNIAKASIDFISKNAKEMGLNQIILGFHGGGEPLLHSNMPFVKSIVKYLHHKKSNNFVPRISSATNGVIEKEDLEWIVDNFDRLNISLDGTEDIHNRQRPRKGGPGSFNQVMKTINYLEKKGFSYGIRSTITKESVKRMPEIVEFFHSISSQKSFHLEPLFECGRCNQTNFEAPNSEEFIKYGSEAKEIGKKLGVEVYYSVSQLENINLRFCGAAGDNFFITPNGDITTCLEVSRPNDPRADVFIIGNYNKETNKFDVNYERINKLRQRTVDKIEGCKDCFSKYNCAGDCLAKVYSQTGDLNSTKENSRCEVNRGLLLHEITQKLNS